MRVVLDASVIVAGFAAHGLCEVVFEVCLDSHHMLMSQELIEEVRTVLRKKLHLPTETIAAIVQFLRDRCELLIPDAVPHTACRDPHDLHVLGLTSAGHAECLVTGDKDLLVLKAFRECRILSPRDFCELLRKQ